MTTTQIIIGIIIAVVVFILLRRRGTANRIANIDNPKIVLLQIGNVSQSQLDSDKGIYSDFYSNVTTKTVNDLKGLTDFIGNSSFDLFHLFVDIDMEGNIFDGTQNKINIYKLVDLIQTRDAKYIFFAKDNPVEGYNKGAQAIKHTTNVVMTLERKENNFPDFFRKVFSKVSKGQPFPVAWNEIAPQIPGAMHENIPVTLAVMGAGGVVLRRDK
jgi:hypothetical protein